MAVFTRLFFVCLLAGFANSHAHAQAFWNKPDAPRVIRDAIAPQPEPVQQKKRPNTKRDQKPRVVEIPDHITQQAPGLPQTAYRVEEPKSRGLFQILFGSREEAQPFREEYHPHNRTHNVFVDPDEIARNANGNRTVCVRLCDGAFMPISTGRSTGRERDADICQAQCPGAETKVYSLRGDKIEDATSREGESYLSLANANKYKNAHDKSCTCRPQGKSWAEYAASMDDPTMKGGDKVLTEQQAKKMAQAPQSRKTADDEANYRLQAKKQDDLISAIDLKPELQTGTVRVIEVGATKLRSTELNFPVQTSPLLQDDIQSKGLNPVERLLLERNIRRPPPAQKSGSVEGKGREG